MLRVDFFQAHSRDRIGHHRWSSNEQTTRAIADGWSSREGITAMRASKPAGTKNSAGVPVAAMPPTPPTANGKKKKKNKGKGRSDDAGLGAALSEEYDDMPALEPLVNSLPRSAQRTGLSPEIESVHLSTTLSVTAAAAARFNATAAAQADLLATATDLYRKMDADPQGTVTEEQDYLGSLPANIRNFVETAWASISNAQSDEMKQRTMYAIAHQMVLSGAGLANGLGKDAAGKFPAYPFDASALADPKFNQAAFNSWEQARKASMPAANGRSPIGSHLPRTPLSQPDINLMHDYDEEEIEYGEDDYYSEDEVDENVDDEDDEDVLMLGMPGGPPLLNADGTDGGKKKNKKKKKKKGKQLATYEETQAVPAPVFPASVPTTKPRRTQTHSAPPRPAGAIPVGTQPGTPGRPQRDVTGTVTHSIPNRSPMPVARTQMPNPPPSSRAAGKQPMYPPASTNTTTNPPAQQPVRSARAAAKAPAPAHAYPHNHPHHHPSPPSSNASAPQKHRPPNAAVQPPAVKQSNKIWSTNSSEERERIKEFWLGLGEDERRALVKIEKETVLKKMKEQQKHSCSCAVCGRKRFVVCQCLAEKFSLTPSPSIFSRFLSHLQLLLDAVHFDLVRSAIEEELEVLYDAYYEELEQYANYQQQYASSGGTMPPPPGPGPFPGSVELDKNGVVVSPGHTKSQPPPPRGKTDPPVNGRTRLPESEFNEDDGEADDYEDEDYEDDEEEEDEDDEDDPEGDEDGEPRQRAPTRRTAPPRARPAVPNGKVNGRDDIFNFGNSMTVTGTQTPLSFNSIAHHSPQDPITS